MKRLSKYMPYGLLVMAALFIVFGLLRGERLIIVEKAVRLCLECIGVG